MQTTLQRTTLAVEKNNDTCKHIYFRHSNRWNAASDIIKHLYKQDFMKQKNIRTGKHTYTNS